MSNEDRGCLLMIGAVLICGGISALIHPWAGVVALGLFLIFVAIF